jgi:hypothetical protein
MVLTTAITDNNSLDENLLYPNSQNEIYQLMDWDEYQYDIEMEFDVQRTVQITTGKQKAE